MNIPQHQKDFMNQLGLPLTAEGLEKFSRLLDGFKAFREAELFNEFEQYAKDNNHKDSLIEIKSFRDQFIKTHADSAQD